MVKEILGLQLGQGEFSYYKLWKRNWNTKDAAFHNTKRLKLNEKRISFSGLKDKHAVTEQLISISKLPNQKIEDKDLKLEYLGQGKQKIGTPQQQGNAFVITIRDLEGPLTFPKAIPNYFDDQRFGKARQNHFIGKLVLQRRFQEAAEQLKLELKNNDAVGALKKKGVVFYIHAYQSYLFNKVLSMLVAESGSNLYARGYALGELAFAETYQKMDLKLPMVQFDFEAQTEWERTMQRILGEEGISPKGFILKQFPEAIAETQYRAAFTAVKDFKTIAFKDDELNGGKKKQVIAFELPRGSYATIFIKSGFLKKGE